MLCNVYRKDWEVTMLLIGEFSKISRVSKRLLHYYDAVGLLTPVHTDEVTGYRYYSTTQLPRLNRILALKDLGMTLEQIKQMLQGDISDEEIQGMLLMKKAEMEQAVLEDLQRLRRIEARLQQNQQVDEVLDIVIKSMPVQPFLSLRTVMATEEETLQLIDQILHVVPARVGAEVLGPATDRGQNRQHQRLNLGAVIIQPVFQVITARPA